MINEFIAFSSCAMSLAPVFNIKNIQLQINRYKRENDKQKCILMLSLRFVLESMHSICCCSITNTIYFSHCT